MDGYDTREVFMEADEVDINISCALFQKSQNFQPQRVTLESYRYAG